MRTGPEFTFATLTLRTLAGGVMGTAINANIRSNAITLQNAAAQFVEPIWFDIDTTAPGTAIRLEGNAGGTNASPVTFLNANNTFTPATGSSMWNGVVGNVGNAAPLFFAPSPDDVIAGPVGASPIVTLSVDGPSAGRPAGDRR